ncbi:MAG: PepSY-associated TM helix domain-containing protein [Desulfobulbaceae bacterium]|nr:PepSY-associated TM helix domain-containing protein [Desulfobulbaceae bacterium]
MAKLSPTTKRLLFDLHRWGGLLLATIVIFYCVTGILLNHRAAFDYFISKEQKVVQVAVSDTASLESFLAGYKKQINRADDPKVIRIREDRTIEFLYGSHGKTTYIIHPAEGRMEIVEKQYQQPLTFLNDLHKAAKTSTFWVILADLAAAIIIGVTLTGLLVFKYRRLDFILLGGGVLLFFVGAWLA